MLSSSTRMEMTLASSPRPVMFVPFVISNCQPCQGHVIQGGLYSPSERGPPMCGQALSRAKKSPFWLKRRISRPPSSEIFKKRLIGTSAFFARNNLEAMVSPDNTRWIYRKIISRCIGIARYSSKPTNGSL